MHLLRNSSLLLASTHLLIAGEWSNLFNGNDLAGWIQRGGKAQYTDEDGTIVGTSVMNTPNSFLCTASDYSDFILEYEFKVDPRLNSGVHIRSLMFPAATELAWEGKNITIGANRVHGYQIEIDPDPKKDRWWSAGIFDEGGCLGSTQESSVARVKPSAIRGAPFSNNRTGTMSVSKRSETP
jgi:hypothetical protein